jgi:hypothetical protein
MATANIPSDKLLIKASHDFVSQFLKQNKDLLNRSINVNAKFYVNHLNVKGNTIMMSNPALIYSEIPAEVKNTVELADDYFTFEPVTDALLKCYRDTPIIQLSHKEAWIHTWCVDGFFINYVWDTRKVVNIEMNDTLSNYDWRFITIDNNAPLVFDETDENQKDFLKFLRSAPIEEMKSTFNFNEIKEQPKTKK